MSRSVPILALTLLVLPALAHGAQGWNHPVNLGPNVNSSDDEYGVSVAPDGVTLYFDSDRRTGFGGKDLYTSTFDGVAWSAAANLGASVNTALREYTPAISPDGQTLVFTSEGFNVHQVTGGAGAWASRAPLPGALNSAVQEWAARFASATTLFLTRYPGSSGGHDVVQSTFSSGSWGAPISLTLNTAADHYAPFVATGGDSMLLVVDGDIHISYFNGLIWTPSVPVQGVVNTEEFYETSPVLSPDGLRMYFTSERTDGQGGYDIWYSDWTDDIVAVETPPVVVGFRLEPARPNPFNPRTTLAFELESAEARVRLAIYDVSGRRLRTLLEGAMPAGRSEIVWDGRDEAGNDLASGTYLYRLETAGESQTRKLSLLR
jgi:hypothetical protein